MLKPGRKPLIEVRRMKEEKTHVMLTKMTKELVDMEKKVFYPPSLRNWRHCLQLHIRIITHSLL